MKKVCVASVILACLLCGCAALQTAATTAAAVASDPNTIELAKVFVDKEVADNISLTLTSGAKTISDINTATSDGELSTTEVSLISTQLLNTAGLATALYKLFKKKVA